MPYIYIVHICSNIILLITVPLWGYVLSFIIFVNIVNLSNY